MRLTTLRKVDFRFSILGWLCKCVLQTHIHPFRSWPRPPRTRTMSKKSSTSTSAAAASAETPTPGSAKRSSGSRRRGSFLYAVGNFFTNPGGAGGIPRRPKRQQQQTQAAGRSSEGAPDGASGERGNPAAAAADPFGQAECPVCAERQPVAQFPPLLLECGHFACRACLTTALRLAISEGMPATCLACSARMHPDDVNAIVGEERLRQKYEMFSLRGVLAADPDCRWCPAPDCKYAVIASGCASCPRLECQLCATSFCYHCKSEWHPSTTCEKARIERHTAELRAAAASAKDSDFSLQSPNSSPSDQHPIQQLPPAEIKQCPRCATYISKENDGSCNHMRCKLCGAEFCWLCRKEINDLHYLSPSGCTFWGKKPWSRKKKILWQLGTLVGAPVGIALLAGLAVPAIIIGLPVWAGRRLRHRLRKAGRHSPAQRRCLVALAVTGSLLVSPLVAVVTVGVAVPILLAYVYGVVPVSLCRADGGCATPGEREDEEATGGDSATPELQVPPAPADLPVDLPTVEILVPAGNGGLMVRVRADVSPDTAAAEMEAVASDDATSSVLGLAGSLAGYRNQDCKSISILSLESGSQQPHPQHPPAASQIGSVEAATGYS